MQKVEIVAWLVSVSLFFSFLFGYVSENVSMFSIGMIFFVTLFWWIIKLDLDGVQSLYRFTRTLLEESKLKSVVKKTKWFISKNWRILLYTTIIILSFQYLQITGMTSAMYVQDISEIWVLAERFAIAYIIIRIIRIPVHYKFRHYQRHCNNEIMTSVDKVDHHVRMMEGEHKSRAREYHSIEVQDANKKIKENATFWAETTIMISGWTELLKIIFPVLIAMMIFLV